MIKVIYSSQSRLVKGAFKKVLKVDFPTPTEMNYISLDMGVTPLVTLDEECETLPLGCVNKAVVAENFFYLEKRKSPSKLIKGDDDKPFLHYLENPDPNIYLYLLVYNDTLNDKSEIYKLLLKAGASFSLVNPFTSEQWQSFIPSFFSKRGYAIDNDAISEILLRTKGDYGSFLNEAQKLLAYELPSKHITRASVEQIILAPLEEDTYRLSNALCRGNRAQAFHIFHDLKVQAVDEVYLIHLLANQFRFLNQVQYLSSVEKKSDNEIAIRLKASLPRVRVSLANLSRMSDGTLARTLESLYETEKSILSGEKDENLAFEIFLANFSL